MAQTSLNTEARMAFRGTLALLRARQDAGGYFDPSLRGLVGSFIGLVIATGLMIAFFSLGASVSEAGASPFHMLVTDVAAYGAQTGVGWVMLGMFGARERFIHYLCADNWISALIVFALVVGSLAATFGGALVFGPSGGNAITALVLTIWFGLLGARVWLSIGVLRIIAGLSGGQVAGVIIAQIVAMFLVLGLLGVGA